MKKWRINFNWKLKGHPFIINEEKLFNYNIYDFKMHVYNCDRQMNIYCKSFYITEISEINIILNYLWLHAVNSKINWKEQVWWYLINLRQVFIIDSEKFTLKMKKAKQIFIMMLFSPTKAGQFTQITLFKKLTDF